MTTLSNVGRRSFLKIAAAVGGASTLGALPNFADTQETAQQCGRPSDNAPGCTVEFRRKADDRAARADCPHWN
jgi:hypothetical protein